MKAHVVVSETTRNIVNREVKRRRKGSALLHTQQSVADEIIKEWDDNRKQSK